VSILPLGINIKDTTIIALPRVEAIVVVRHTIPQQVNTVDKMRGVIQAMGMAGVIVVLEYGIPLSCN
jgi:hypothetical protein